MKEDPVADRLESVSSDFFSRNIALSLSKRVSKAQIAQILHLTLKQSIFWDNFSPILANIFTSL